MKRARAPITDTELYDAVSSVSDPRFPGKGYRLGTIEQSRAKINKSNNLTSNTHIVHYDTSLSTPHITQPDTRKAL